MALPYTHLIKAVSPRLMAKAIESFDRATAVVVISCWVAAVLMTGFALYTVNLSIQAKRAADSVMSVEPIIPQIKQKPVDAREVQPLVERLKNLYPGVAFVYRNNLDVTAGDGNRFRDWLAAVGYVETIAPQYHWTMSHFCVGKCGGHDLMAATLSGEKVTFELPQPNAKK